MGTAARNSLVRIIALWALIAVPLASVSAREAPAAFAGSGRPSDGIRPVPLSGFHV